MLGASGFSKSFKCVLSSSHVPIASQIEMYGVGRNGKHNVNPISWCSLYNFEWDQVFPFSVLHTPCANIVKTCLQQVSKRAATQRQWEPDYSWPRKATCIRASWRSANLGQTTTRSAKREQKQSENSGSGLSVLDLTPIQRGWAMNWTC